MPNYVSLYQDYELNNQADYGRASEMVKRHDSPRRSSSQRARRSSGSMNGIHRRRRKRWSW